MQMSICAKQYGPLFVAPVHLTPDRQSNIAGQRNGSLCLCPRVPRCWNRAERQTVASLADTPSGEVNTGSPNRERGPQPTGSVPIHDLVIGTEHVATVVSETGAESLWVDLDVVRPATRARWRRVQGRLRYDRKGKLKKDGSVEWCQCKPSEKVGDKISVRIKSVQPYSGRFEVERLDHEERRRRLAPTGADRRRAMGKRGLARIEVADGIPLDEIELGREFLGSVVKLDSYGALFDCGVVRKGPKGKLFKTLGLLQRKRFPSKWACDADAVVRDDVDRRLCKGDSLPVYVRGVHPANGFLWLSAEPVSREDLELEQKLWKLKIQRKKKRKGPDTLVIGGDRRGMVRELAKYGAFIDIGLTTDGLVHYTCMGEKYRLGWEETLAVGVDVLVKVNDVTGTRVNLELLAVGNDIDETMNLVEEDASGPFARPLANVQTAGNGPVTTRGAGRQYVGDVDGDVDAGGDGDGGGDDGEDDDSVGEGDDGGDDTFSDDYFEDRYGDF